LAVSLENRNLKGKFEILSGLPAYGDMYISIPENSYTQFSEGLAVKFISKDKSEWIGNFQTGNSILKFASELKNDGNILIIAFGIAYIIDVENKKHVSEFGYDYNKVFQYKDSLILIGEYSISIVENSYKIKHFRDLCYEGISNIKFEDGNVTGILNNSDSTGNDYIESHFVLNVETLEFTENGIAKSKNLTESRKWWEIWK
jgi:hypothetical protein